MAAFTAVVLLAALCLFPKFLVQKARGEAQPAEQAEKREEARDPALRPADVPRPGETVRKDAGAKYERPGTSKAAALPDGP